MFDPFCGRKLTFCQIFLGGWVGLGVGAQHLHPLAMGMGKIALGFYIFLAYNDRILPAFRYLAHVPAINPVVNVQQLGKYIPWAMIM